MQCTQQDPRCTQQLQGAACRRVADDGVADGYIRRQAGRIRAGKENSARHGIHQGAAPLGYWRPTSPGRPASYAPGVLIPDPVYAPIVQAIFARYVAGGWSYPRLAEWLNGDPSIPPPPNQAEWYSTTVGGVLSNPLYCGLVRYNHRPEGVYERAALGSEFIVPGRHPALIDRAMFDRAAARRAEASTQQGYERHAASLGSGLFVCASCGGPMTTSHQGPRMLYRCSWYQRRKGMRDGTHTAPAYVGDLAHDALLREVRRLRRSSWLQEIGACPVDGAHMLAQQGLLPVLSAGTAVAALIDARLMRGDAAGLREFVLAVVASARIIERVPERRPTWLRAEVTWTPVVRRLLQGGHWRLDPPAPAPEEPERAVRHREAQRRYSARQAR